MAVAIARPQGIISNGKSRYDVTNTIFVAFSGLHIYSNIASRTPLFIQVKVAVCFLISSGTWNITKAVESEIRSMI